MNSPVLPANYLNYASMPPGQYNGLMCMHCTAPELGLSVRIDGGHIYWNCHRASCGDVGRMPLGIFSTRFKMENYDTPREFPHPGYTGPCFPLTEEDTQFFNERYEIDPTRHGFKRGEGVYLFPITDPRGAIRGWVTRYLQKSPVDDGTYQGPKTRTFSAKAGEQCISFYVNRYTPKCPLVVVEDSISAAKCYEAGVRACALLGTGLNAERVRELQQFKKIILALDADATGLAFAHARKWGAAFESCKVQVLQKDLKDTPKSAILSTLNLGE